MKTTKILTLLGLCLCFIISTPFESDAQILKEIGRLAGRKLKKKVEDKVVETLAEEIARRAFRPINDVMDDWIRENMKRDSAYAGLSDDSLAIILQGNYSKVLSSLNQAAKVPASYDFEYSMDVRITDGKDANNITWLIDTEGKAMAWEQVEGDENQIMLMDLERDIILLYNKNTKEAQALPGMLSLGASFAATQVEVEGVDPMANMRKGGSKSILGYSSDQYFFDDDEFESESWVSDEVPFSYESAFGMLFQRVSPKLFKGDHEMYSGMMLEATTKEKGKKRGKYKSISKWETLAINEKSIVIDNQSYKFGMQ